MGLGLHLPFARRPSGVLLPSDRLGGVRGRVQIELGGELVFETRNLFVNTGYQRIAQYLAGRAPATPNYCALGNGDGSGPGSTVTPAAADTALGFELLRLQVNSRGLVGSATARFYTQFSATDVPRALTEVALFDSAGASGQVTAATGSTLTDSTQVWVPNQWANWTVYISLGLGAGQKRAITANTAGQLTISANWTTQPDTTSTYVIGGVGASQSMFAHAPITPTLTKTQQPMNVIWSLALPQN